MNNPVRIAVIGAGAMGRNHIRFVQEEPEAELVAIADAFEAARPVAEAAGVPFYLDNEEMFKEAKPDGVIIVTPNHLHLPVARQALAYGVVPLVEKPISDDLDDALRFAEEAEKPGFRCSWVSTAATTRRSIRRRRLLLREFWGRSQFRRSTT
ncbi:Oxidoreductase family, NAD-binding Rossmann fold [Actinobaculum suis]|uniref:Gfo/Idh/MocA family oxidoreductase n=1 Tax=Actinobaculum suis TaxID=1657 RepID=A0A1G7DGG0_9ACTO|nr:Gfo/Idh/MocA family oxidoreductase [Actinobaculum suis]MDY5154085.1 Gfo/Idh/MocA family oxidoreductase [Actinobaculum suis]SDE50602.1 Oxidoreductase family, NAD-binding Rossmann fold [Actinobaculum suis]